MLKVKFIVDEDMIARYLLSGRVVEQKLMRCLPKYYLKLKQDNVIFSKEFDLDVPTKYIEEIKKQDEFVEVVKFAHINKLRLEKIFNSNNEKLTSFLIKILKVKDFILPEQTIYVFDYHINAGRNIGDSKIFFGMRDYDKQLNENYDLTYLVHEILHSFFKNGRLTHALIENITDCELCKFLNNSQWHYPYHKYIIDTHKQLYPYWNLFLNKSKDEIEHDVDFNEYAYNIDDFEHLRDKLSSMDIYEFTQFMCSNN